MIKLGQTVDVTKVEWADKMWLIKCPECRKFTSKIYSVMAWKKGGDGWWTAAWDMSLKEARAYIEGLR